MALVATQPRRLRLFRTKMLPQPLPRHGAYSARRKKLELPRGDFGRRPPLGGNDARLQEPHPPLWGHQRGTRRPRANSFPRQLRGIVRKFSDGEGTPRVLREKVHQAPPWTQILQIDRALTPDTSGATCLLSRR